MMSDSGGGSCGNQVMRAIVQDRRGMDRVDGGNPE